MFLEEIWKDIRGYEGLYQVSNLGRVKSVGRCITKNYGGNIRPFLLKDKILRPCFDGKKHYVHVNLSKDGIVTTYNIHRLVAIAFIPNPYGYLEINHIDENKTNNRVDNLEWCDHSYNNTYGSKLHQTRGMKNPQNKLSDHDVVEIRRRRSNGELLRTLADEYGISKSHVCSICKGTFWGWL